MLVYFIDAKKQCTLFLADIESVYTHLAFVSGLKRMSTSVYIYIYIYVYTVCVRNETA